MPSERIAAVFLAALVCCASCAPRPKSRKAHDPHDPHDYPQTRTPPHHHYIIWKRLLPFLQTAFINAVSGAIVNWFYPWTVVPYPPGKIGISQLWGGYPPHHGYPKHHYYGRRRRSLMKSS